MSTKPVDVFMTGEPEGASCPISVAAIFGGMLIGSFQEMDEQDLVRWPEISYTGFVGEIGDVLVILDVGPDSILATVDDDDDGLWTIELTGEFLATNKG
jgi:hypothetical protein